MREDDFIVLTMAIRTDDWRAAQTSAAFSTDDFVALRFQSRGVSVMPGGPHLRTRVNPAPRLSAPSRPRHPSSCTISISPRKFDTRESRPSRLEGVTILPFEQR